MVKNFTTRASEQKDASLESPFGVSEQKDAPLESPLGASEQKDAPLESPLGASEQKDASLEHFFEAPEPQSLPLESPTVVSLHQRPPKWFPMAAPSGHWLLKCFPTAANEWRSPLSAGRVGAYCIRPQMFGTRNGSVWLEGALICNCPCRGIGWGVCNTPLLLGTPLGHPPIKWFPTRANEWKLPLSAGRVGAYCIRPRCSKQETAARGREAPPRCFPMAANGWRSPLSAGRVGRKSIRPQTIRAGNGGVWPQGAYKMFSNVGEWMAVAPVGR